MEDIRIRPVVFEVEHEGHTMRYQIERHKTGDTFVTVFNEQNSVDFMFRNSNTKRLGIIGEMLIAIARDAEKRNAEGPQ